MNQFNPKNLTLKRKRGRPRKYPKPDVDGNQNRKLGPVSNGASVNLALPREPFDNANKAMIGEVVSGVVEAVFDAGFLLSVRVGDSDTTLRGVVFRPGQYVPVSPENDVAPDVQMIRRSKVPAGSYTRADSFRTKKRNEQDVKGRRNETHSVIRLPAANQIGRAATSSSVVPAEGMKVPAVAEETEHAGGDGGFPVGNQSFDSLNAVPFFDQLSAGASRASDMLLTKGKEVHESSNPVNGPAAVSQVPMACLQSPCSQPQPSSTDGMQKEGSFHQPSFDDQEELEDKTMMFPSRPFEKLLSEGFKIIPPPVQITKNGAENSKTSGGTLAKDASVDQEDQANSMEENPTITRLQTPQSHLERQSAVACKASVNHKAGRMNELLQVLEFERVNQERQAGDEPLLRSQPNVRTEI